jgi:glycosyltransferase involved in cell wall biosynthesis
MPAIPVIVAGDGPQREMLESSAPPSVRFVGLRTMDELRQLRAQSVVVVSPSIWYENSPISVLEAMRDGRPVIATDIGGHPELVADGGGLMIPPSEPDALADAMSRLWADRDAAAVTGHAGRERLLASFTLAEHVSKLEAIYEEVRAPGVP